MSVDTRMLFHSLCTSIEEKRRERLYPLFISISLYSVCVCVHAHVHVCILHKVMLELLLMCMLCVSFCQIADNIFHLDIHYLCIYYAHSGL